MRIVHLIWDEDNVLHIARHGVDPEEAEETCFNRRPFIERGRDGLYYISGQTETGRHLFVVARFLGRGAARVITARDMDHKERRRYKRRKGV